MSLKVTDLKKYYGNKMDIRNLILDVHDTEKNMRVQIAEFTRHKGASYINFIDSSQSSDDIVAHYQLLEMDMAATMKADNERLFDLHASKFGLRDISLSRAIEIIIKEVREIAEKEHEVEREE